MPLTSVDCERSFSIMNKIKNKFTGRLTIKNLNIKMLLKLYDENWEDLD